ncbi:MAG: hypothetical protein P8H97_04850 [Pseudomonadales bacterium]|nr:hypothetical protein [Pseudomonadales bacterium]MDG2079482.1 hypothetical protein [Pseudomonadales bacterium]
MKNDRPNLLATRTISATPANHRRNSGNGNPANTSTMPLAQSVEKAQRG